MKKTILILGIAVSAAAFIANHNAYGIHRTFYHLTAASFNWVQTLYDFGTIKQNKPVTYTFKFTNSGNEPLIIASVQASCGCTVTDYSKDPIQPNTEGYVKATYNAVKLGMFNKTVTVNANTAEPVLLTIKGNVVE